MATIFEVGIERCVHLNDLKVPLRGSLRAESVQVLDYQHQNDSSQGESKISYLPSCGCSTANEVETLSRFWHRFCWLVTLLLLQSLSTFILRHFGNLLVKHPVVVLFLTMLIGSGGNVGSQSAVLVIRTIAKGSLNSTDQLSKLVQKELWTGYVRPQSINIYVVVVCRWRSPAPVSFACTSSTEIAGKSLVILNQVSNSQFAQLFAYQCY